MFLILALVFFVAWILALVAFKVTMGAIHLILVIAVISLVMHFVRGRTTV